MVLTIFYPLNKSEWYAKGEADGGIYFEVPATFKTDGTCDVEATDIAVEQFLEALKISQSSGF
jgi:hypothetical protein